MTAAPRVLKSPYQHASALLLPCPQLIDFGLAKVMNFDQAARTWTLCGKPEYLAPEIIQSKGHSKEVDWWALGIFIHEMLAGYPPYYDRDAFKIYQQVSARSIRVHTRIGALPTEEARPFSTHR